LVLAFLFLGYGSDIRAEDGIDFGLSRRKKPVAEQLPFVARILL
jgi:hypothetical protein